MSQKPKFEYLENKLIAKILIEKPYPFVVGELFPHVTSIAGNKIAPDIDILQRIPSHKLAVGYEVKWLHHFKKGTSWYLFYRGIGQALSYFRYGVDKSILVLGMSNDVPRESISSTMSEIESIIESFSTLRAFDARIRKYFDNFFKETPMLQGAKGLLLETYCGWNCFGIMVWTAYDDLLMTKLSAEQYFPIYLNKKLEHRKECLLRKEFKYKEKFLEKHAKGREA